MTSKGSILSVGVPLDRGTPSHFEHDDETAYTLISGDRVSEIHTPQDTFRRCHEMLHALHTNDSEYKARYVNVEPQVAQVVEDCRLHQKHWHWEPDCTPVLHEQATRKFLKKERADLAKQLKEHPEQKGGWGEFATLLRQAAVLVGLGENMLKALQPIHDPVQHQLALSILGKIQFGDEQEAAEWLQKIFFGPKQEQPGVEIHHGGSIVEEKNTCADPNLKIIELKHEVKITQAKTGYRRGRIGPRIHRPALAKPVLPQKLFIKRSPRIPGGTILIDASGSMGGFEQVTEWVVNAPFATVAYYSGRDGRGWLYVFARNGRRAANIVHPPGRGNEVDGLALDWLMKQRGPRVMVTDRRFCGAVDSHMQIARLHQLELAHQVKVEDYR